MTTSTSPFRTQPTAAELFTPPAFAEQAQRMLASAQARFGADRFRMEGEGDGGGDDGGAGGADDGDKGGADDGDKGGDKGGDADKGKGGDSAKVEDLPDWAQKMVKDLRTEAASARTNAKKTAADEARNALVQDLGKALGLVKGDEDKLTPEQLADRVNKAESTAKQTTLELAVYRTAGKAGADPDALLDSRGFLSSIQDLDPSANNFTTKVTDAIKDAVKNNPKLKASQAGAGSSSADHGTGGSGDKGQRKAKGLSGAVGGHYGS